MSQQDEQDSVLELLRSWPMYSPPPTPAAWSIGVVPRHDQTASPEFFDGHIGFDASLPIPNMSPPSASPREKFSIRGCYPHSKARARRELDLYGTYMPLIPTRWEWLGESNWTYRPLKPTRRERQRESNLGVFKRGGRYLPTKSTSVGYVTAKGSQTNRILVGIERLGRMLKTAYALLSDAENQQIVEMNMVRHLLGKLKTVAYEADNVLDKFIFEAHLWRGDTALQQRTVDQICKINFRLHSIHEDAQFIGLTDNRQIHPLNLPLKTQVFPSIQVEEEVTQFLRSLRAWTAHQLDSSTQPIALPNGGELVQLQHGLSEQQSFVEFDATNSRTHFVGANPTLNEVFVEFFGPSMHENFDSWLQRTQIPWPARSSPQPIALPTGGEMVQLGLSEQQSFVEFDATTSGTHFVGANPTMNEVFVEFFGPSMDENLDPRPQCIQIPYPARSSTRPIGPPTGGEMTQLCSSEQQSLVEFDAANSITHVGANATTKEVSVEVFSPSMDENLDSRPLCIQTCRPARSSPRPIASPTGGEMVQLGSCEQESSAEFNATDSRTHGVREDQSTPTVSHSKKKNASKCVTTRSSISLADLQQHFGRSRKDTADYFGVSVSTFKRIIHRDHGIVRWPHCRKNNGNGSLFKPKLVNESVQAAEEPLSPTSSLPVAVGSNHRNSSGTKPPEPGQAGIENEIVGHVQEHNELLPNFIEGSNQSNVENGSKEEGNIKDPSYDSFPPNNPAMDLPISISICEKSGEAARGPSKLAFQQKESTPSATYPNPNALVFTQPQIASRVPLCYDPAPRQAATSTISPQLTARQDMRTFKATYREDIIKFHLSLISGFVELKKEVAKRLELELGSFKVKYEDGDHLWILIACDEDLQDCLKFSSSVGNQVINLLVLDKDADSRNKRKSCGGLKRKRS